MRKRYRSLFAIDSLILKWILVSQSFFISIPQKPCLFSEWREKGIATAYLTASWLTEPLCTAHQLYRQTLIVDTLYPTDSGLKRWIRKSSLLLGSSAYTLLSLVTTLPGIELRFLATTMQSKPFIHFRGEAEEKPFIDSTFSLLSWNLCCVTGGYSITDGGVLPWIFRKEQIISAIRSQDADIVCLYEIFDIQTAIYLIDGLKDSYSHFYFHIGPTVIGLSSGLFVAAKAAVSAPEFIPFPEEALYGRSKHCKKGVFGFDVQHDGKSLARIFSTHFQHSETPDHPEIGELEARKREMDVILERMGKTDKVCVLTGDLNLEEREFHASPWKEIFDKGEITGCGSTWGGDQFCASLVGKIPSSPANLDHTMIRKEGSAMITTSFVETGFDPATFREEAISDHKGLFSIISLQNPN